MQTRHYGVWPQGKPKGLQPVSHSVYDNLVQSAARAGDRIAISFYGGCITYRQLAEDVSRLAGYLNAHGIQANDRVAIYMQNAPQFVIAYYAILAVNAVIVPINPMCKRAELAHILADAGAEAVIFGDELSPEVAAVQADHDAPTLICARYAEYADPAMAHALPASPLDADTPNIGTPWTVALAANHPAPEHTRTPDDWCIIPYSSGTTGQPKGCLHKHSSVNAIIQAYPQWLNVAEGSRVLATLPFCHVTGMQHSMNLPIVTGSTIYLTTRWNAALAADLIERERIQHWRSITTMMIDFLSLPGIEERDLSSLVAVGGGGAQMPQPVAEKMARVIGLDYIEAYGLTETIAPTHINPPAKPKSQCLGIPIFDVDCRIVDPATGEELGPGEPGEIVTHGPQVFVGYWNNEAETNAAFTKIDGKRFLRTGDIGMMDDEGYFFFVDRLKRMINVSGLKVWPAEVEAILHGHPEIAEACIVGDADPRTGEAVRAVIVPKDSQAPPGAQALASWCRQNMANYKVPKHFEFRRTLPRSGAGKVLWKELAQASTGLLPKAG